MSILHKLKIVNKILVVVFLVLLPTFSHSQKLELGITGYGNNIYISSISGEKITLIDSTELKNNYHFDLANYNFGLYRITFDNNKWIDFVNDGKDIKITTDSKHVLDSLNVLDSESNKLFYTFLKLNKAYKTKTELLQFILARYPKDDSYYLDTKKRLNDLQYDYLQFVNITSQKERSAFVAKYILSAQLPVIDSEIPIDKQLDYLKSHSLDYINFNDASLIYSDLFTNKSIEYLTYFRNPQMPKEILDKEFTKAVDSLLNKARVNQQVYQHITEYLIDGFKKFGFDQVLDYIVENYVIKDDLCLDVKTEGMIKRRIEQAKNFKIGSIVPNIVLQNIEGKVIDLSKIKSEKVLLVFYTTWCPHCKELLPKLNELYKNQAMEKYEIIAISLDEKKEDWVKFVEINSPSLINASDLKGWDGETVNDYFIYATPTMLLIDKDKRIISKPTTIEGVKQSIIKN
ncbi:MAG: redoxin domain-containing protein [Melioribacteraceae bacterium]|nr:redoxin domain-containing protein [Melioribacteraceae bacterium]